MEPATADLFHVTAALYDYTQATGEMPLMLGGWEVEDEAICPPPTLVERLRAIPSEPLHYTYGKDFRRAPEVAAALLSTDVTIGGVAPSPAHVTTLANSSQGLLLSLTALRARGVRHAVIAAPCYYATTRICAHLGIATTIIPALDFLTGALDIPTMVAAMRRKGRVLILTNPAYSIGVEYPPDQLDALWKALPPNAYIVLDETRLGLHWTSDAPWYRADYPINTLVLRSPSKIFLLNGLKTSFLYGPPALLREIEGISEYLLGSVAGNAEAVALAYLESWCQWRDEAAHHCPGPMLAWKDAIIAQMRRRLTQVEAVLSTDGVMLAPIDSGPYVLAAMPRAQWSFADGVAVARTTGVLLVTAAHFHHQSDEWCGFRINLCAPPRQALLRIMATTPPAG